MSAAMMMITSSLAGKSRSFCWPPCSVADILPAGLVVIDEACRLLGVERFSVSEADLLLGYLTSPAFRGVVLPAAS